VISCKVESCEGLVILSCLCGVGLGWGGEDGFEFGGAVGGGVLGEGAFLAGAGDAMEFGVGEGEGGCCFGAVCRDEDFFAGGEEFVQAFPCVAKDGGAAGGGFKEASGGAVAHFGHGLAGDVEGEAR